MNEQLDNFRVTQVARKVSAIERHIEVLKDKLNSRELLPCEQPTIDSRNVL